MSVYCKMMKGVNFAQKWLIIILLFCAVITSLLQVFFRFVIKMPLSWSEELSRYLFIWLSMLGASAALEQDKHFRMDILVLAFPPKVKKVLAVVWDIINAVFCVVMVYYGFILTNNNIIQLSPAMRISIAIPYVSIPISGILMLLQIINRQIVTPAVNAKEAKQI